ncbi:MAG: hypothetical protein JWR19_4511 [Pedosphaera sp.]|nr:hypothetical protein [Pedosphaera sp.]
MTIAEITTGITTLGGVAKSLSSVLEAVKDGRVREAIIETQSKVLDSQAKLLHFQMEFDALAQTNRELESKLAEKQCWEAVAARYELRQFSPDIIAYALKRDLAGSEPHHFVCPHCFGERKRSILQRPGRGDEVLICHACKLQIYTEESSAGGCSAW